MWIYLKLVIDLRSTRIGKRNEEGYAWTLLAAEGRELKEIVPNFCDRLVGQTDNA